MRPLVRRLVYCLMLWAIPAAAQSGRLLWSFSPIASIGAAEGSEIFFTALIPAQVAVTPDDQIIVADREESHLKVFNRSGHLVRTLGRAGEGPGELGYPNAIAVALDTTVWVVNSGRRLVGLHRDGSAISRQLQLPGDGSIEQMSFGGRQVPLLLRSRSDTLSLWQGVARGTNPLVTLVRPSNQRVAVAECRTAMPHRPVFAPGIAWATRGDIVAYSTGADWRVSIHRGELPVRYLHRQAPPRPATPALALSEVAAGIQIMALSSRRPCLVTGAEIVTGAGFETHLPAYRSLVFQSDDLLWAVHHTVPSEPGAADVFSLTSGWIGTVNLGERLPVAFLSNGDMVSLEQDEGVPALHIYQVNR